MAEPEQNPHAEICRLIAENVKIKDELDRVKMERDGYRKSYELMQKSMESQSELMDGLKQQVRSQANEIKKLKEENVQWELLIRNAPCPPEKHHEDN